MGEDEEEFTQEEVGGLEAVLSEIKYASEDLHDFLTWVAHHEDYSEGEFTDALGMVYSYARSKNPSMDEEESEHEGS